MLEISTNQIYPSEIDNHNTSDLCSQETCNKKETKYIKVKINGVALFITLCDKHANEILDYMEVNKNGK